ncbi:MAG: amidohydrolase family protein [Armatimonadota bacterium]
MREIIDAHVHVWTPDTERYPLAAGYTRENMRPRSFTPEELFAHCRPEGVRRVVLIQMSFYGFDNRYMLDSMRRFPGVFSGVAVIDWTAPRPDEEMARLAKEGVRGFRIRSGDTPAPDWAETEPLDRMFRTAAERRLAICPLLGPNALPSLARMCARHLKTPVVIDHLARIGFDGEIREADVHALCQMAHFPEVRVKVSAFYALGKKRPPHAELEPVIRRVHEAFGAKRLMWASDCPFAVQEERYVDSLALVRDRCPWLKPDEREWLLRRTAEDTFFRPE